MTRLRSVLFAGAVTLALVTGGAVAFVTLGKENVVSAPNVAAAAISPEELSQAADRRLFFGHMSVGKNVLSGVQDVYATRNAGAPEVMEFSRDAGAPQLPGDGGIFAHALIGRNRHPQEKLANFDAALRGGVADQVDVAVLKFCYVDISWYTDVDALFATYKETLDALQRDYPNVTFLHVTAPLTTKPTKLKQRVKVLIGRDDNEARGRYNDLLRQAYGPDRLFDLAAVESTAPDGTKGATLYAGYSNDGAHLNDSGSSAAAVEFLRLLARTNVS